MKRTLKLLILDDERAVRDRRLGSRIDRVRALNAISTSGAKVRHDSGGRLIVIDARKSAQDALEKSLPNARLVAVDADVKGSIPRLDETESLFLDALQIRSSKSYRDRKRRRKYGETPEEQALFDASCVREEY
jgi:hypothetical protein